MATPPDITLPTHRHDEIISFEADGLHFIELNQAEQLKAAYRLRYEICVEKLHWIEGDPETRLEYDEFDQYSYHFGCFLDRQLVGYIRMTREDTPEGTMSRKYFRQLWQKEPLYPVKLTADVSRLIVDKRKLRKGQLAAALFGLYRIVYARTQMVSPKVEYLYLISAPSMLQGLRWRVGLVVKKHGQGVTSDGKITAAAAIDLRASRRLLKLVAPWRLSSFNRVAKQAARP
jgi:N-acyl-L-homoserine lactone synthetase